jgi:hypothetical protein
VADLSHEIDLRKLDFEGRYRCGGAEH